MIQELETVRINAFSCYGRIAPEWLEESFAPDGACSIVDARSHGYAVGQSAKADYAPIKVAEELGSL